MGKNAKPPIGLIPKKIVEERRMKEVFRAISSYFDRGLKIPLEWVSEYNELLEKLDKYEKTGIEHTYCLHNFYAGTDKD